MPIGSVRSGILGSGVAIPDAQDLYAHYDFSKEDGSTTVTDQTGNGRDISGSYSGTSVDINGVQAGDFDGSDDNLSTTWSTVSEPWHIFAVIQYKTESGDILDGASQAESRMYGPVFGDWRLYQGGSSVVIGGTSDTNPHIIGGLFGSTDVLRLDGSQLASADSGSSDLTGLTVGSRGNNEKYGDVKIGEILVYPQDKSDIQSEIEQYLSDKWGITI